MAITSTKTRIAPTPSGFLHLGNAMSFILTAAIAQQRNAKLVLRIDDLDSDRIQPEFVSDIFETLAWLKMDWAEGPSDKKELSNQWSQMHRVNQYDLLINRLLDDGHLYPCSCSRKEIADRGGSILKNHECRLKHVNPDQPDISWRIKLPEECLVEIRDEINGKLVVDLNVVMPDFVVRRRDGIPSYQIASLADDLHFGIDLIVRGEDLLASTTAQLYLADLLGESNFRNTSFLHHPLIKANDGSKLSKSAGSDALKSMRMDGVKPETVYDLISDHLGFDTPVHDLDSFIKVFDSQLHLRG